MSCLLMSQAVGQPAGGPASWQHGASVSVGGRSL